MLLGLALLGFVPVAPAAYPTLITNLATLREAGPTARVAALDMTGEIWWAEARSGRVILRDDSGVEHLQLHLPANAMAAGQRLRLVGDCLVSRGRDAISLASVPVVDNDGLHATVEKSGAVTLRAGQHPLRVEWFNRTDKSALELEFAGPDLLRQRVPAGALLRRVGNDWTSGLDYRAFEGQWWPALPNFACLPPVKTGTTTNFNLELRTRDEHVGLEFSGAIQIPRDGDYTFFLRSDDGSRLFLGDPTFRVEQLEEFSPQPAIRLEGGPVAENAPEYQRAEIVGVVAFVDQLPGRLELDLISGAGRVRVLVAEDSPCAFGIVAQNRVRATGVCRSVRDAGGRRIAGELYVQRLADLTQEYITPDLWAAYPVTSISNALNRLEQSAAPGVLQLRGQFSVRPGERLPEVRDATGGIAIETTTNGVAPGATVAVLGCLEKSPADAVVRCAILEVVSDGDKSPGALPLLTAVEQVHQLSPEALARRYPVQLRGVITAVLQGDAVIVQDETRGIYVALQRPIPAQVGDLCEVRGVAMPGDFSPYISASDYKALGPAALPAPQSPTWDQLLNGSLHCQFVELEGVVTAISTNDVTLLTRGGLVKIQLDARAPQLPAASVGTVVRLRGCLFAAWDDQAKRVKVGDIRLNQTSVETSLQVTGDPLGLPTRRVGELLRFDPRAGALRPVKVAGQIIYQEGNSAFLMDGDSGLRFIYAGEVNAHVCDLVEVAGFPDVSEVAPLLRNATVRRHGLAELPAPRALPAEDLLRDEYDSTLVRMEGVLLGLVRTGNGATLEMQSGLRRFVAVVNDLSGLDQPPAPGSRLELTGTYVGQGGNRVLGQPIESFRLLLNTGFDVRVLSRPPWWNLKRLLAVVGALLAVLVAALVWIKLLQRKVAERSRQLEAQIRQRQQAEHQRAVELERSRVAHDLHDDLGAGLTRVNMLTTLAANPATSPEQKTQHLADLNTMARDMVTSLDEIVWAINPRNDTLASLVGYFCAHAQRLLDLAGVKCGLDVPPDLPDIQLDSKFRHELLMAFKEAVTNVVRHASAKKVWLRIAVSGGRLAVELEDDGSGFGSQTAAAGADGLANMRERLATLGGTCEISSQPAGGTIVRFAAPLKALSS